MHSFRHSRARILFEVACAFGVSASSVWAWMQTYASAFLPAAAITALYGLVHAFDMVRRRPAVGESASAESATDQGDLLASLEFAPPGPVPNDEPEFAEPLVEAVPETDAKRNRKSSKQRGRRNGPEAELEATRVENEPVAAEPEPELAEPEPQLHVVDNAPEAPEYYPATPLFEAEPFVRQQRAAFGRKAR
jgi:hypothetical protein